MWNWFAGAALMCLLAMSTLAGPARSGSTTPDLFAGIGDSAESVSAMILRARRAALANRDSKRYDYNYGISSQENAVAACFHAADWQVRRKRRGLHATLDEVKKVKRKGERVKVTMLVTNVYRNGEIKRWVKCHVRHDQIVFWKYS